MLVHLLPIGRGRYDLYAEPPDVDHGPLEHDAGRVRRWMHKAGEQWQRLVDTARMGEDTGRFARWRDAVISSLAESIEEQRTLWSLRNATDATALFPSALESVVAQATLNRMLAASQRHHRQWFAVHLVLFIVSGILAFLPGPNIVAYYLGFRAFGHFQSWRGARQATTLVHWTMTASDELAELATLAEEPHATRAARVDALAEQLELPHLPAYFERAGA